MQADELLYKCQADTTTLVCSATRIGNPMKALEDMRELIVRYSRARIAHAQLKMLAATLQFNLDLALEGVLERVGDEIEDDFLPHVAINVGRLAQRGTVDSQLEAGFLSSRAEHACELSR